MQVTWKRTALSGLVAFGLSANGCGGPESSGAPTTAATTAAVASGAAPASRACQQPMPVPALVAPAGNVLERQLQAVGVQIYTCAATASGAAWAFTAPEATLYGRGGEVVGKHYAGPTWQASDGSTVVGARVAGATPDPTAIPWLLLRATSHAGAGEMTEVTYIQRVATTGGLAPAEGCTPASLGAVARVPYTASYCFSEAK